MKLLEQRPSWDGLSEVSGGCCEEVELEAQENSLEKL